MKTINEQLIAPCGINCGVCMAYLRETNKCPGCRLPDSHKPITRVRCKIKKCRFFQEGKAKFCFECNCFPCNNLKHLDSRYRKKYAMSMIENLEEIKDKGIEKFIKSQYRKYKCTKCSSLISVHNKKCYFCDKIKK